MSSTTIDRPVDDTDYGYHTFHECRACENQTVYDICYSCQKKYTCHDCLDTGVITKTEWSEPNDSHDVDYKCHCQLD